MDTPNLPISDDIWLTVWNDIKGFNSGFYVFLILFFLWSYKKQIGDALDKMLGLFIKKKTTLNYTHKQLQKHIIFKHLNYWLETGIKSIQLKSKLQEDLDYASNKEKMAREVLRIIYETYLETLTKFIDENDLDNMDSDVALFYLNDCLVKNSITTRQRFIERGIPEKFIHKFLVVNKIADDLINQTITNVYNKSKEISTSTKTYLAYNTLDAYLNILFTNLSETIDTINGDLKSETFDGKPMFKGYVSILRPPHSTYVMIVKDKLKEMLVESCASRINVIKFFEKDGKKYQSSLYEETVPGVTSEILNMQMMPVGLEKGIFKIMKTNSVITASIEKFDGVSLDRLASRGVKGVIITPIINNEVIDGAIVMDYMNKTSFEKICKAEGLDEMVQEYATFMKPYIEYPANFQF